MTDNLDSLREQIAETDIEIAKLIVKRNEIALCVGKTKIKSGISVKNHAVEGVVIERYKNAVKGTSVSADTIESVARTLINESVDVQSLIPRNVESKKIAIVGGAGKMGRWFESFFKNDGHSVKIIDPVIPKTSMHDVSDSDIVVVSVPVSSVSSVLTELDKLCKKDAVIFDITSIKSPFIDTLRKMSIGRNVCSVHPMFGPSARSIADKNIVICDTGSEDTVDVVKSIFDCRGANITITTAERHDELMAYSLALAHASNISFFTAVRESNIPLKEIESVASSTFKRCMAACIPVSKETPALYHQIQSLNPNCREMWKRYNRAISDVSDASLDRNDRAFRKIMMSGRKYLED